MTDQPLDPAAMDYAELVRAHRKLRSAYAGASAERDRLAAALAAAQERIETLTELPEPLDPVEQAAIDGKDWDYVLRMLRKARDANHGYRRITEDQRGRLLDAEDALAAARERERRVRDLHFIVVNTYTSGPVCGTCWTENNGSTGPGVWPCETHRALAGEGAAD